MTRVRLNFSGRTPVELTLFNGAVWKFEDDPWISVDLLGKDGSTLLTIDAPRDSGDPDVAIGVIPIPWRVAYDDFHE